MSALAKTIDIHPSEDASIDQSPQTIKTTRSLGVSDINTLFVQNVTGLTDGVSVFNKQFKQQHLLPQNPVSFARSFQLLQQWEGMVEHVNSDTFIATISDKTNKSNPEEEVEIFVAEVSKDDIPFVRPGSFFYWSVGYEHGIGTPLQRVSRIRFQRMPGITTRDIKRAKNNAKILDDLFA